MLVRTTVVFAFAILSFDAIVNDAVQAAPQAKFPYQAEVIATQIEVHSGPGSRFYTTSKLDKNTKVTVHRHDPGGWSMITPPQGSYSLVRSDYIKKETANLGIVTQNHVVVRVASSVNKHREVEQRRLMKGDRIHILGEERVSDRGRVLMMYRIEPPRGEFRWVKGDDLIPLDPTRRRVHDLNPFAVPSNAVEINKPAPSPHKNQHRNPILDSPDLSFPIAGGTKKITKQANNPLGKRTGAVENGPSLAVIERDRKILRSLDKNFRDMVQKDVPMWNIVDLTHDYKKLQKSTPVTAIASQIDLRLQAMQRYSKMKAEYDDLIKLTSATDQKEAQLASLQNAAQIQYATLESPFENQIPNQFQYQDNPFDAPLDDSFGFPADATHAFLPDMGPDPHGYQSAELPQQWTESERTTAEFPSAWTEIPQPIANPQTNPLPAPPALPSTAQLPSQHFPQTELPPPIQSPQPQPQFSGAGIVQRVGRNPQSRTPQFALISPAGKFLTYLQPAPGVDLNRYVGQSVGVHGNRKTEPALQSDVIAVTALTPVQLTR